MPNVKTPDGVDLEEGVEGLVEKPVVAENGSDEPECLDLLSGFCMERLFDDSKKASYSVQSEDFEMGVRKKSDWRGESVDHIPEVLRGLPETKKMFDFIITPSTDRTQIKQRQALITSLLELDGLDEAIKLKNCCYAVYSGIFEHLFATIKVDFYQTQTALFAYRHGNKSIASDIVEKGIELVQKGRESLSSLAALFSESGNPLLLTIAKEMEAFGKSLECLTRDFFLKEDFSKVESVSTRIGRAFNDFNEKVGVFFEFANISKTDGYTSAGLDVSLPRTYKQGWNFVRRKESTDFKQVLNDSPDEHEVTVYSGSNMSGKSFSGLKKEFFMQCLAQSFGYVPCEAGSNFPVMHDSFHYLDRASTDHFRDLSAFGSETDNWEKLTLSLGNKPFVCVDEGWSTTSAQDQYKLLRAGAVLYLPSKGARVFLASHNEKFLQKHISQPNLGIYHFETDIDEATGTPIYHYKLAHGLRDSNALAVAKGRGLDLSIIENAQKYLDGQDVRMGETAKPNFRDVVPYTEEERQKLKNPEHRGRIPYAKKESLLTVFSSDRSFRLGLDLPMEDSDIRFSGWSPHNVELRKNAINDMVIRGDALTSQEVLERQRTFELLAGNDRFEEMLDIEQKLLFIIKFLPIADFANFLRFNLAMNPLDVGRRNAYDLNAIYAYLEMNKKLMGDSFPMEQQLQDIKKWKSRVDRYKVVIDNRNVEEILEMKDKEQNEVISDPKIVNLFEKFSKDDEPTPEVWCGIVTKRRIGLYLCFLHENNCRKTIYNKSYDVLDKLVGGYRRYENLSRDKEHINRYSQDFFNLASRFEDGFDEQNKGKINRNRIKALIEKIKIFLNSKECDKEERIELYSSLDPLEYFFNLLERIQKDVILSNEEMVEELEAGITPNGIDDGFNGAVDVCKKSDKFLPPLKIWECDLNKVKDEIGVIVRYWKEIKRGEELNSYNQWGGTLSFILLIEMFVDGRDYPAEFLAILRSYDSIDTHEMADNLEYYFEEYVTNPSRGVRHKCANVGSGTSLISRVRNIVGEKTRIGERDKTVLEKEVYFSRDRDVQHSVNSCIASAMGLFYIGHMIKGQGMSPVSFNATGEIHLPEAWSLFVKKDKQVRNDVSFRQGKKSKLLGSSNMSGKTHWEKGAMSALLWALATGYAPCAEGATMPLLDNIMYFDRVTSRSDQSLSSYGEEIMRVKQMMEKAVAGKVNLVMLDEFGSSTSPKYQDALYYAMVVEMLKRGQYAAFASHCHDVTDKLAESFPELLDVVHFGHTTKRDEGGAINVTFDHKMSPKREDSEAIDVAEMLRLNPEIIKFARLI